MANIKVGDRVKIIKHSMKEYEGKEGEIIRVGEGIKPKTQPVVDRLPKMESEPRYDVKLDSGDLVRHIREQQLKKL